MRKSATISAAHRRVLEEAILQDYEEGRRRSRFAPSHDAGKRRLAAHKQQIKDATKATRELRKLLWIDKLLTASMPIHRTMAQLAEWLERQSGPEPKRGAHRPTMYPHFTAAAIQLRGAGVPRAAIVRVGVAFLPGLPDDGSDFDRLDEMIKAAEKRGRTRQKSARGSS